jgi:hypothetical protein
MHQTLSAQKEITQTRELSAVLYGSVWDAEEWMTEWEGDLCVNDAFAAYQKVSLVTQCINAYSHFTTRHGFTTRIKQNDTTAQKCRDTVNTLNKRVNLDGMIAIAIIKREIWGRAAFEIVKDTNGNIVALLPLSSNAIVPNINETTQMIESFQYTGAKNGTLAVEDVLYFPRLPLDRTWVGQSAVTPILNVVRLKLNLYKDLLESAKRLWAGMGLFQMDTSDLKDPAKKEARMREFANQLKPGRSIVYNKAVEAKVIDIRPDIGGLVRAIEKVDEEIMGNWQMPKAILSREKTVTKATLSAALNALYEGPIESLQRVFKREIERQWYDRIVKNVLKLDPEVYSVKHVWNVVVSQDPTLIRSLAYAVNVGAMSKEEFFEIMGWEMKQPQVQMPPTNDVKTPGELEDLIADVAEIKERLDTPKEFEEEK